MNVLQVTEELYPNRMGGVAKHVHDLSQALIDTGIEVDVLVAKQDRSAGFGDPQYDVISDGRLTRGLRRIVKMNYDVVHLHQLGPRPFGFLSNPLLEFVAQVTGAEVVVTPHGAIDVLVSPPGVESSKYPGIALNAYLAYISAVESSLVSAFVGVSPGQLEFMSEAGIPERKQWMIPNGLTPEFYENHDSEPFVEKYGIEEETTMLFFIGRLSPRKRVADLVRALNLIEDDWPDVELFLAGPDGGVKDELRYLSQKLGVRDGVNFIGKIDDRMKHSGYERADIFVSPSEYEAFGITLIEAMAHYTPVVSADQIGSRYVLGDGEFGLLYDCGEVRALADAITDLLDSRERCRVLTRRGRERAEMFRWEDVAENVRDLYRRVSTGGFA